MDTAPPVTTALAPRHKTLVEKFSAKYTIEPEKLLTILKATAFKVSSGEVSNEQMGALLVVADQYGLNPFTREIFAFEDKFKGIVPVVGVDGWSRIINDHDQLDGIEFNRSEETLSVTHGGKEAFKWMECVIHRKDRKHPTRVKEYFDEVYQLPRGQNQTHGPWQSHPKRMHRHKVLIQCARLAFGFSGIYDEDEAERIIAAQAIEGTATRIPEASATARMKEQLKTADEDGTQRIAGVGNAEPPAELVSFEQLKTEIDAAKSLAELDLVLPKISAHPASDLRSDLLRNWHDKGHPFREPTSEGDKVVIRRAPEKEKGTAKRGESVLKQIAEAKSKQALDEAADYSLSFTWTPEQQAKINDAFKQRLAQL